MIWLALKHRSKKGDHRGHVLIQASVFPRGTAAVTARTEKTRFIFLFWSLREVWDDVVLMCRLFPTPYDMLPHSSVSVWCNWLKWLQIHRVQFQITVGCFETQAKVFCSIEQGHIIQLYPSRFLPSAKPQPACNTIHFAIGLTRDVANDCRVCVSLWDVKVSAEETSVMIEVGI